MKTHVMVPGWSCPLVLGHGTPGETGRILPSELSRASLALNLGTAKAKDGRQKKYFYNGASFTNRPLRMLGLKPQHRHL